MAKVSQREMEAQFENDWTEQDRLAEIEAQDEAFSHLDDMDNPFEPFEDDLDARLDVWDKTLHPEEFVDGTWDSGCMFQHLEPIDYHDDRVI